MNYEVEDVRPQHAKDAIDMLDASNISGIVLSMSIMISEIRADLTLSHKPLIVAHHPGIKLIAAKLIEMTGMGLAEAAQFHDAYELCKKAQGRLAEPAGK